MEDLDLLQLDQTILNLIQVLDQLEEEVLVMLGLMKDLDQMRQITLEPMKVFQLISEDQDLIMPGLMADLDKMEVQDPMLSQLMKGHDKVEVDRLEIIMEEIPDQQAALPEEDQAAHSMLEDPPQAPTGDGLTVLLLTLL